MGAASSAPSEYSDTSSSFLGEAIVKAPLETFDIPSILWEFELGEAKGGCAWVYGSADGGRVG